MQSEKIFQEGQLLHQRGQLAEALNRYERVIKMQPQHAPARIFRALLLQQSGRANEAVVEAELAIKVMKQPNLAVLVNYGVILKNAGRLTEAAEAYEKVLELDKTISSAKANLATIYLIQGRLEESKECFEEIARTMNDAAPWLNLARIAIMQDRLNDANEYLNKAEDLDLTHPDGNMLRGRLAAYDKDFKTAYKHCMSGLKKSIAHRDSWLLLQSLESQVYQLEEIEECLERLAKIEVQSGTVLSIAVDLCRKHWLWKPLQKLEQMLSKSLLQSIDKVPTASDVFTLLGADITQEAHLKVATRCWDALTQSASRNKIEILRKNNGEKIKVGILSSDLRGHAIGYLMAGLVEFLPKSKIEWWAYNNALSETSSTGERLKENFDRFIYISKLNDLELSEKIRSDEIDVLIDLNQMTAMTRASVMAYRPAPVQIQWLGMPGTLGAGDDVDYVIVDPWVVDEINADGFSECLFMLPRSYQPNDHKPPNLSLCASRDEAGLPENGFVFGIFNQYYKFSPATFELWGEILRRVPQAFLWLLDPKNDQHKQRIRDQAKAQGIAPDRLIFAPHKPQAEHLARLQWVDLVLDTWPYNAHTTCSDALRAGVPVLTFPQHTFASRVAEGILKTAGLDGWVATSGKDYVDKAIAYSQRSREEVDSIKSQVKRVYWNSRMVDNAWLGKILETMVLALYNREKNGLKPTSLKLNDQLEIDTLGFGRQATSEIKTESSDLLEDQLEKIEVDIKDESELLIEKKLPEWVQVLEKAGKKARSNNIAILKKAVLQMEEIPLVVDVGAASFNKEIGYEYLIDKGIARLVGFEPDPNSFTKLEQTSNRVYLPNALGDGQSHELSICFASGMNSIFEPNQRWLSLFPAFAKWAEVKKKITVETKRLDEINEVEKARLLKLDVQGAEMMIMQNGERILNDLVILQIEASPTPLYHGESSFFEIGLWLQNRGFVLHALSDVVKRYFKPFGTDANPYSGKHQIFQVDAVFIPNPLNWSELSKERLESLAFFSHAVYRSFDLTMMALDSLDKRDKGSRVDTYRIYLDQAGLDA
jgi:FkbM family methyltransferase